MNIAFFLYHHNDLDQNTPIMWRLMRDGHRISAILLDDAAFDIERDERLVFLKGFEAFSLTTVSDLIDLPGSEWLFKQHAGKTSGFARRGIRKLLRESGISVRAAERALQSLDVESCVFEWGGIGARNRSEFLLAAKRLGLRTICVPHGQHVLLDAAVNPIVAKALKDGTKLRAGYNVYDRYVFQAPLHRDSQIKLGMDPAMCMVIGSARYCPEWLRVNSDLYPPYAPGFAANDRLNVVFMVHHWGYNVDRDTVLENIAAIIDQDWINLVIKEHPRATNARMPQHIRDKAASVDRVRLVDTEASSTSLMRWADAVINYGSSIAMEAVVNKTPVVNPVFFQSNRTIFEETGACLEAHSPDELIGRLKDLHTKEASAIDDARRQAFMKEAVYGGHEPFDVLAAYAAVITGGDLGPMLADELH